VIPAATQAWQLLSILFAAAFTLATMLVAGRLLLRRLGLKCYRGEEDALALVAGGAALSQIVFLLCSVKLVSATAFLIAGGGVLALGFRYGALGRAASWAAPVGFSPALRITAIAIFGVFGAFYLANAMAPEMSPDGSTYHLGLVARYLREGGFRPITDNFYASLPQGVEMLYLFAFAFGRHSSAALIHLAFTIALALMLVFYGRRFGFGQAGLSAAVVVFVSPVVGKDGTSAYNDVALAAIVFAAFYLLQIWRVRRAIGLVALAGLCAGFAFASKYTAFAAILYAAGVVILCRARPLLKSLAVLCACVLFMAGPWLLKNWIVVDNPFSPFLNSWFPNRYMSHSFEESYRARFRRYSLTHLSEIPLEVTVRGRELNGMIGPVFLLAPAGLLALRSPAGHQIIAALLVAGFPYFANIGTRFLIPCLPFLALALSLAISRVRWFAPALILFHAVTSFPPAARAYAAQHAWILDRFPVKAALRLESEETYLRREFPGYLIARMIEDTVPPGESVFTFSDVPWAYTSRNIRVAYTAASNHVLTDILWTPLVKRYRPETALVFRFPPSKLRALRIEQTAADPARGWNVAEIEAGPARIAKITAAPNPWEANMAFDGSPVTRWRSLETARPGMFLQADFDNPIETDSVRVVCANSTENSHAVKLLGQDSSGAWTELAASPEIVPYAPGVDWRREAVRQMKKLGADYMLVFRQDLFAADYTANMASWGLTLAGEAASVKLFRLN
jgi:hypothetical protein